MADISREKEDELASKILERAQLAQMRRQLKIGLSKVPSETRDDEQYEENHTKADITDDSTDNYTLGSAYSATPRSRASMVSPRKRQSGDPREMSAIMNASPLKKVLLDGIKDGESSENVSPVSRRFVRPSTPPKTASRPASVHIPQKSSYDNRTPTTPKLTNAHTAFTNSLNSAEKNAMTKADTATLTKVPSTPKRGNSSQKKQAGVNKNNTDDSTGADLLMYLATSPYSSARAHNTTYNRKNSVSSVTKVPTTPYTSLYMSHSHTQEMNDDAVRFSALKASLNSPQSTFKVPHVVGSQANNGQWFPDILMDSPSLYLGSALSPSANKKKLASPGPGSGSGHAVSTHLPVPSTPSRELHHQTNTNLLKTPNFNMGDYLQNIFSPSPQVSLNDLGNSHMTEMQAKSALAVGPVEGGSVHSSPTRIASDV
ncbi:uncharacterized protein GVI51_M03839 [Nakaseomyces glabratus]|uniref:Protein STB1 n=1 Tax=Candida glabrata (strain ATCC 2001 / BCRC 20586 / JCM 3761 / NBRC 0622 / NRRL Y-65 / CBS 138) TaxID=284593 RepID=Q6FJS7_CANGA|nr:uncharacterized protein CAGL0M03927g [Nakaseomyces glabratus]KAH7593699.1 hypothetical protein J7294_04844 [Nakaseomyces glabratus]KAH7600150.1 hypothetical protein J7293_04836 [Nakaseomyces glabratus]KAI8381788.1 hypothetical protein J6894_04812 [Nakaseomyces glabratus]KTB12878.1 Protein STB1 [Nakaseomyces glabratus]KTB16580.1 Protein STB1 [Nakaseomyces glabratus]|eukprot:XP_449517.1 uncharacterized protein CAGL0M03927g [[Candida] glabrata]